MVCCAAKSFPAQEMVLLYSKVVSSPGNGFAVQQSRFQPRKWFCCTAKSFPAQQMVLLFSNVVSSAGNDSAVDHQLADWDLSPLLPYFVAPPLYDCSLDFL
jgi:hypothetical protein